MNNTEQLVRGHFSEAPYSRQRWETHTESSTTLIPFLKAQKADLILDVGCGTNPYKEHVPNVIGIDVGNYPEADINLSCERVHQLGIFQSGCADVVLALGSINFGDRAQVLNQLNICVNWCRPGGILILRARLMDHTYLDNNKPYEHFAWNLDEVYQITQEIPEVEFLKEPVLETAAGGSKRIGGGHGQPDYSRKINLAVWYWKKYEMD